MPTRPAREPLGRRLSVTLEVSVRGGRVSRDNETVCDVVSRWVIRHVRRRFPELVVEGWSPSMSPGRTFVGYWFGEVEVFLVDRRYAGHDAY